MIKKYLQFINESTNNLDEIAGMIDYTELDVNASEEQLYKLAQIATDYDFATMCVRPDKVKYLRGVLDELNEEKGSNVGITTVVSFPEGTNTTQDKIVECLQCIRDGADDIDMVLNYNELIRLDNESGEENEEFGDLEHEIKQLADICHDNNKLLKVIVESGNLTSEQTEYATVICDNAGADFIKTSTGMVNIGAELDKVKVMYNTINKLNSDMQIKASGAIRTESDVMNFLPYVDRFGIGYGSVNNIYGIDTSSESSY